MQAGKTAGVGHSLKAAAVAALWLSGSACGLGADAGVGVNPSTQLGVNDPAARFRGPLAYDFGVTNVRWEAATPEYSYVVFDLYWSYSWRAKWTEPAEKNVTGKDMEVENWDAAWVFVKFLPEKDSEEAKTYNRWQHASLDINPANHSMPAGATNSVGLSEDPSTTLGAGGQRGMGVFIYRDAVGHGVNDFKGIKLRWMHGRETVAPRRATARERKVDPALAAVKVLAIPMVYVPEGAFKLGSGAPSRIAPFPDGPTLPLLYANVMNEVGSFTDGSWRGGPMIPFLVDAEWNGSVEPGHSASRARRIGAVAGQLWGQVGFNMHSSQYWQFPLSSTIGAPGTLDDRFPTGYEALYCMKHQLTQGQFVEFLNLLPPTTAAALATVPEGEFAPTAKDPHPWEKLGHTIIDPEKLRKESGAKFKPAELGIEVEPGDRVDSSGPAGAAAGSGGSSGKRPVYAARLPHRTCAFLTWRDGLAYAAWAGLRPMSEMEFEKICRGPLNPVPCEHAWGSAEQVPAFDLRDGDQPTERFAKGNYHPVESDAPLTRAGIFATPDSDRFAAGATYWGVLEMEFAQVVMSVGTTNGRAFRGSHGEGRLPPGAAQETPRPADWTIPGARMGIRMSHRITANTPSDRLPSYPDNGGGRSVRASWRGVRSAAIGKRAALAPEQSPQAWAKVPTGTHTNTADWDVPRDNIKVGNIKWEAGPKQYSTVTCDLEWNNSWRAAWAEPGEKNVTGKPLKVESWDAAWVFVKFRNPGEKGFAHAMLSAAVSDHVKPAGASLDVGLSDDGSQGIGAFVYRSAEGQGANSFKGLKLRWVHPASSSAAAGNSAGTSPAVFDPSKAELAVYAVPMVYVPRCSFKTKGVWGHQLSLITRGETTKPGGYRVGPQPTLTHPWGMKVVPGENARKEGRVPGLKDVWPNGYNAFYCLKYAIGQGEYAAFLNALPPETAGRFVAGTYDVNRYSIRRLADQGHYAADAPDRACTSLGWEDSYAYTAWAGLRPPTDLEYEKACRGPREVPRDDDAWTASACVPADGVAKVRGAAGARVSYWGIHDLSLTGIPFEWPHTVRNEMGFAFKGTHGTGTPEQLADWPKETPISDIYDDPWGWGTLIGLWFDPSDTGSLQKSATMQDRTGRYGSLAVRTAPARSNDDAPLQVAPLPILTTYDVGIFHLTGRFRNPGSAAVKVEIAGLPDACFVEGAASRVFTAGAKAETPFRVLVALTGQDAARIKQGDEMVSLQIRAVGGAVQADQSVLLAMSRSAGEPQTIRASHGGEIGIRVLNATDRPLPLSIALQPVAACKVTESERRLDIPAGKDAVAAFPVPRQKFAADGLVGMPFRMTVGQGAAQAGEIMVNLANDSRWWVGRKLKGGPPTVRGALAPGGEKAKGGDAPPEAETTAPEGLPGDFFTLDSPPRRWNVVETGATNVPLAEAGPLAVKGSSAIAGTRVFSPAQRDVVIRVTPAETGSHTLRIWINDAVVHDSQAPGKAEAKPFRIRAGMNTMVASWRAGADGTEGAAPVGVTFVDGKTGQPLADLALDMEGK